MNREKHTVTSVRANAHAPERKTLSGRRVLITILVALAALIAVPSVAQAASGLSPNTNNVSIDGQTVAFGANAQGSLPATQTIYFWTSEASGGFLNTSTKRLDVDVNLSNSAYERNGGSCEVQTPGGGYTFRARISWSGGGSSSRRCSIDLKLKAGTPIGTQNSSLTFAQTGTGWGGSSVTSGTASITGDVTAESGNVIRVYGPGNETASYDYGDVAIGDSSSRTFTLKNLGTTAMSGAARALSGASSDYSITATTCGATLALYAQCTVTVRFQPTTATTHTQSLDFTSSSGHSRSIPLSGNGLTPVADIAVTPMSYDYGNTAVGNPFAKVYTVSNEGNTTLDLAFNHDPGTDPLTFPLNGGASTCGAVLNVGNSCTYSVSFDPAAAGAAAQSGSFTVTGTTPLVVSPVEKSVAVSGTRSPAVAAYEVRDTAGSTVKTSHDFGSLAVGANTSYTFTIVNTGNVTIPSLPTTIFGGNSSRFTVTSSTCGGALIRAASCSVTVRFTADRAGPSVSGLRLTPGAATPQAPTRTIPLNGNGNGITVMNDITQNLTGVNQKRWLDTLTLSPGGSVPSDTVRVSFAVDITPGKSIAGVEINTATTSDYAAPGGSYQNIADVLSGNVTVEKKAGSSQALVRAEVPLGNTGLGTGNGNYGFSNGTTLGVCLGGGDYKTDDRTVWFRVRDSDGNYTTPVGSRVRFNNQNYTCPNDQGPQISGPRILSVGGVNQPGGSSQAPAAKNQSATFQFNTRAKVTLDILTQATTSFPVTGLNWRIRNTRTGAMFRLVNGNYTACGEPCIDESNYTQGAKENFADTGQGQQNLTIPAIPSRGRWVVEGAPQTTSNEDDAHFFGLGVLRVNDAALPTVNFGGTLTSRPDTDTTYTIAANSSDPSDPINALDSEGGRAQVIEWDLDGNTSNGPLGDGFETRYESDSATNLPSTFTTQDFDTTGKTPGTYSIRARVTDNGSIMASETVARTQIYTYVTTINTPPVAQSETVYIEADETQPSDLDFNATDADGDPYKVAITPAGGNDGSLGGNLNGPIGDNTKPYSWPATYTGTDTFGFVATDDHKGISGNGTLTVRVRPNTTIDDSNFSGTLFNANLAGPGKFLGSTTDTSADFEFSSPQTPIASFECRHLLDGDVLSDWTECSDQPTGDIEFDDLGDGLHRLEIRAINDEGVEDGTPAFRTWRVDNTSPTTEVRVGPDSNLPNQQPRLTNDTTPSYIFRATAAERSLQEYITYECRVMFGPNTGQWVACGAPSDSQGSDIVDIVGPDFGITDPLPEGPYSIEIRGTDEVGNLGPVLIENFIVDTSPPETALASGAEGLVNTRNLEYVLSSSEGQSTFLCKVEGENVGVVVPMGPCPGPAADGSRPTFTVPADDKYTLTAIAIDPATNQDPTPLEVDFEVDATEPTTTMDPQVDYGSGPTAARRTQSYKVDITFTGNDTRNLTGFQCRIDSADDEDWALCQSVQRFSGLSDGDHKVEIRAKDEAGNYDSTPEVLEWTIDHTPPVTEITVAPDPVTNDDEPTFEFTTNEGISGSVCSLDGAAAVACTSPVTLAELGVNDPLSDGDHEFTVKSTDIAGNVEQTPDTASWKQDTVVPEVVLNSKPAAFTPLGDVDFGWVVKDGNPPAESPEPDAECAFDPIDANNIDAGEWEACDRSLNISEADNTNGVHTFSVRATDAAGNVSPVVTHTWEVLGSKPVAPTVDDSSPADGETTRVGTAYFAFSHPLDETGALEGLFCQLDGGTWTACDGNFSAEGLSDGDHEFAVRAQDIAGNISDPTVISWSVQSNAPVTSINSGPSASTSSPDASFSFSSNKAGTFECKVDDGAWEACVSPTSLSALADGQHTFRVRAVSSVAPVGVKDPTPPSRTWTVDSGLPSVTIGSAPEGTVQSRNANVTFSSDDPEATFLCKLGDGLYDACSSPVSLNNLPDGTINFLVKAVDGAGNQSAAPAAATWMIACQDGFEGTVPNCTEITSPGGDNIKANLTGGELSLASLGAVPLPADQIVLDGVRNAGNGKWFVPKTGVDFQKVVQSIPDALGPGTVVNVEISISATGPGVGTLPSGGGASVFKLPVRADVQAKLGETPVIAEGTECALKPVTFDLEGTYNEGAKSVHLESNAVSFPKVTGCATFKTIIDDLLELPRGDIAMSTDFNLTQEVAKTPCGPGTTGDFEPNCTPIATPGDPILTVSAKSPKKVKSGKPVTITASVKNTGETAATGVKVCLTLKKAKKLAKGKALTCKTVADVAAGGTGTAKFKVKTKKIKAKKKKLNYSVSASAAKGAKPKSYVGHVTLMK